MFSSLWSFFTGSGSTDSSSVTRAEAQSCGEHPSAGGLLESDECHHDLRMIGAEEREMEFQLQQCYTALKRARRQREALAEGYECLIMSTHDALEHPVLERFVNGAGPLFHIDSLALERVRKEVDDDDVASEDLSEPDASDYSDEDIARALRLRQTAAVPIHSPIDGSGAAAPEEASASGFLAVKDSQKKRVVTVYELSQLESRDFQSATEYEEWSSFYSLWRARRALTSHATRFEVLGKIEEECDRLDERLFELRIKLSSVKAKKRRADFQLEAYAEAMSHNTHMYEAPAVEMSSNAPARGSSTMLGVPRETDLV